LTVEHNTLLVDGRGQGHEGKGHDAWAGFPYAQMNEARITQAHLDAHGFDVIGDGAAVYDVFLQLKRYRRHITMTAPGKIEVRDEIESGSPHVFTEALHSDMRVMPVTSGRYEISINGAKLDVLLHSPVDAVSKIEKNVVMGPGRPGSVDKGSPEERGERLLVSTPKTAEVAYFDWELTF
jgi:hypothetical protein